MILIKPSMHEVDENMATFTTNHEKYNRLVLMLVNGGTKITRALFEKHFKAMTPGGHVPFPWTIDEFLQAHKKKILFSQTGRNKERTFFPIASGTEIDNWDLLMFCFILVDVCGVTVAIQMDIDQLKKMRNKLCHLSEPSIDTMMYERSVLKIKYGFDRLLVEIDDQLLTKEISNILQAAKEGPLALQDTINVMHQFYSMGEETREILSQHSTVLNEIMEKIREMEKKQDLILKNQVPMDTESVNVPETFIELLVKNCVSDKEEFISKLLVHLYKEATHSREADKLCKEDYPKLMAALKDTLDKFTAQDRSIVDAEQKCVIFRVRCTSVASLLSLFYDCIAGELTKEFKPLEACVRQIRGCEEVTLEAVMFEEEVLKTLSKTVLSLEEIITRSYNTASQSSAGRQNSDIATITDVNLVERLSPTAEDERRIHHTVRLTIKTDQDGKDRLKQSVKDGSFDSSINRLREEIVDQYNLTKLSIEARVCDVESSSCEDAGQVQKDEGIVKTQKIKPVRGNFPEQQQSSSSHLSLEKYLVRKQPLDDTPPRQSLTKLPVSSPAKEPKSDGTSISSSEYKSSVFKESEYISRSLHSEMSFNLGTAATTSRMSMISRRQRRRSFESISTGIDSGLGTDITDAESVECPFIDYDNNTHSLRDTDEISLNDINISDDEELVRGVGHLQLPTILQSPIHSNTVTNTCSDEYLLKQGIFLNESYLAGVKAKSSKSKIFYEQFLSPEQLQVIQRKDPKKFVSCVLHLEGSHEAFCIPTSPSKEFHQIDISGRSRIGRAYSEDEVVVEILENEQQLDKHFGKVLGISKRNRCKNIKHPVFLCTPDDAESHIVRPMCKTVPKINVLQEQIRKTFRTQRALRFKIDIYEYNEHQGILFNPRTETLSRAEMQSCIFLVAFICWEPNQLYPRGAILKRFPCGNNITTGRSILNLRYEISQHFSKNTIEEMKTLSQRVKESKSNGVSEVHEDTIVDMTHLRAFTIDRHDSKDINYAFSIQDSQNDCYKVGVHITNVSLYVTKGSPIDEDAFKRAMTVKSDVDIPRYMLPDQIAQELCCLLENVKRPVLSVYLYLNRFGRPMQSYQPNYSIEKSFIKCSKNLSYEQAQQMANEKGNNNALSYDLRKLFRLIREVRRNRLGKAMFAQSSNEIETEPSASSCLEAQFIAEELVILANKKVSDVLRKYKIALPLLSQLPPAKRDIEAFQRKYESYLGILVHFQNPDTGLFPNYTLENVLQTNPHRRLMVSETIWNTIRPFSKSSVENILNDNIHPIQCIIYHEWLSIQGNVFYSPSSDHEEAGQRLRYVQCTTPTRRYADLVVQRQLHSCLERQQFGYCYSESDIQKICSHLNHVMKNMHSFQVDCRNLKTAAELRTRPQIRNCIVKTISDKSLIAVYSNRMHSEHSDIEIMFNLLDMGYKLHKSENSNTHLEQVTGKWRKRFYDTKSMPLLEKNLTNAKENETKSEMSKSQVFQILNHNRDLLFIKLCDWAKLVGNAANNYVKDLRHNISRISVDADTVGEDDISTECSEINSYTLFSFIFHTGQPLKIQMSAEPTQGIIAPKPVLLELSESIALCLQHHDDPVLYLSQYATVHACAQYTSCQEYREIWLPIVSMEAAVGATSNEDSYNIKDIEINIIDKNRGTFCLPVQFCRNRNIGFSGVFSEENESLDEEETSCSYDWLCIKRKVSGKQIPGSTEQVTDYFWVGHAEIVDVQKRKNEKYQNISLLREQRYEITFQLHKRSDAFPDMMKNKAGVKCNLEVLRKTEVDRRIESHLKIFPSKGQHVGVQIALKRKQNSLEFERIKISNSIDRDITRFSQEDDPTKRPLPRNNRMQGKAIDTALRNRFTLIQGPPGTGKTYTGIKLILLFDKINSILNKTHVHVKKQVLFCGPSNRAVDLVAKWMLKRLGNLCPNFVRVYGKATEAHDYPIPGISFTSKGSSIYQADEELRQVSLHHLIRSKDNLYAEKINEMESKFRAENKRPDIQIYLEYLDVLRFAVNAELRNHDVILCTTGVASNSKLHRSTTIYQIIVDEAGMCSEPQCMVPLLACKAEQVVLIGDHKQLRPIVRCLSAAELGLDKSLFERYATEKDNTAPFVMLEEQYRMNPSLCEFPSKEFYSGRLLTNQGLWQYETLDIWPTDANGNKHTHVLIHVEGQESVLTVSTEEGNEQSKSNKAEIKIVTTVYRYLIEENVPASSINIISQYNAQCFEIKEELRKEGFKNYLVNTVVSSQGGEWDYVIFSTVRSLPEYKIEPNPTLGWCKHNLGFITDKNQINVALTRARKGLVIIGNRNLLFCDEVWKKLVNYYEQTKCIKLPGEFPPPPRTRQQKLRDARAQSRFRFGTGSNKQQSKVSTGGRKKEDAKPKFYKAKSASSNQETGLSSLKNTGTSSVHETGASAKEEEYAGALQETATSGCLKTGARKKHKTSVGKTVKSKCK